jgi:hypothetical protein
MRSISNKVRVATRHLHHNRPSRSAIPPKPFRAFANPDDNANIDFLAERFHNLDVNSAFLPLPMDTTWISAPQKPLGCSASAETEEIDPLFIGDGSLTSPFTEVTDEVWRENAFLKDLHVLADFYDFKVIECSKLAPQVNKPGSTSTCTGGRLTCLHPSYAPDRRTLGPEYCADRLFFDHFYRRVDSDKTALENFTNKSVHRIVVSFNEATTD